MIIATDFVDVRIYRVMCGVNNWLIIPTLRKLCIKQVKFIRPTTIR